MKDLYFTYNWNNKLDANAFTIIQLSNDKIKIGDEFKIILKPLSVLLGKGIAEVKAIRTIKLKDLNDFMSYIDTGYSLDQTIKIIKDRYKKFKVNYETAKFDVILLVYKSK